MRYQDCRIGGSLLLCLLCLLCGLLATQVHARDARPTVAVTLSSSSPLELLKTGKYAQLDAQMNGIQAAFEHGKSDDMGVLQAFRAFYNPDPSLEPYYVEWRKRYPHSYAAHLALGIYYKYQGREARGTAFASQTSPGRLALMGLANASAVPELNKSLQLTKKPVLTYVHLMSIAGDADDRSTADADLAAANRIDPHNFIVRLKYMVMMQPRWLGRAGDMQAFYDRCKTDGLSASQLNILQAIMLEDDASTRENNHMEDIVTRDEYAKAAALAAPHPTWLGPGEYGMLVRGASRLSIQLKDYRSALNYADMGLKMDASASDLLLYRGVSNLELGHQAQAVADLRKAAALGDAWSQVYVGGLYVKGEGVPKDLDKARVLFEAAAKQGSEDGARNLEALRQGEAEGLKLQDKE